jgi:hypothetical protein
MLLVVLDRGESCGEDVLVVGVEPMPFPASERRSAAGSGGVPYPPADDKLIPGHNVPESVPIPLVPVVGLPPSLG